jgi:hypothetical protein
MIYIDLSYFMYDNLFNAHTIFKIAISDFVRTRIGGYV